MKIELHVPEGTHKIYILDADVQNMMCYIGAHAQLTVVHSPEKSIMHMKQSYVLQAASRLVLRGWYEHAFDGQLDVLLQGAYAHADVKMGFKGVDTAVARLTTLQRHEAPHTTSSFVFKSLLADHAQTMHAGMIYIVQGARDSNAKLHSNHMLKGANAYAQVQPNLEVLTNEVQCAHGSAIGMFDENVLFYMQTRGLNVISTTQLLEEAFFSEVRS